MNNETEERWLFRNNRIFTIPALIGLLISFYGVLTENLAFMIIGIWAAGLGGIATLGIIAMKRLALQEISALKSWIRNSGGEV